jgi:hypothetical protein
MGWVRRRESRSYPGHRCAGRIVICGPSFPARSPREFGGPVNTATFTFAKREFDDAFHALDQVIAVMVIIVAIGLLADRLLFSPWERFFHRRWGTGSIN